MALTKPPTILLEAKDVTIRFARPGAAPTVVLDRFDLQIRAGEVLGLLGPSGSGKSTLLRMLAGLLQPSSGSILSLGREGGERATPDIAMVFQSFALFPWLTVLDNVELGLRAAGIPVEERRARAAAAIDLIGLDGFESAYPKELSGGMRQRVGFARALVLDPDILMMDEPFSALDPLTAENLRTDLLDLWIARRIPTRAMVIVTRSIEEAVFLADRILVLKGSPAQVVADVRPELPHWRDRESPEFQQAVHRLYSVLTEHGTRRPTEHRALIARLPPASVETMISVIESVHTTGGSAMLATAASLVQFDLEDLLACVSGVELLGFATAAEGRLDLTPEGRALAEASIDGRKELFRQATIARVPNFKDLVERIHLAPERRVSSESVLDSLERHFSADETRRQLEVLIAWGRYAELFSFDAETGVIAERRASSDVQ